MKVHSIFLKSFKKFQDYSLDLTDGELGIPKDLVVLVGDNGSGKSTILQAIAATLGTATRRLLSPGKLQWPGFDFSLVDASRRMPVHVDLNVGFSEEELDATHRCFEKTPFVSSSDVVVPARNRLVTLSMNKGGVRGDTAGAYFQCRGREYARQVLQHLEEGSEIFKRVGSVFWYDEHRRATSLTVEGEQGSEHARDPIDENLLRRRLADWQLFHERVLRGDYTLRPGQKDFFKLLQKAYTEVFPGRSLRGSMPRGEDNLLAEPWFIFAHHHQEYELSELSAGERAIFPILCDFAVLNINHSVILIDELELHLHPPLQQAFLRALGRLGENNQIIITTHSQSVVDVVPDDAIVRVDS